MAIQSTGTYHIQQHDRKDGSLTRIFGYREGWYGTAHFDDPAEAIEMKARWEELWGREFEFRYDPEKADPTVDLIETDGAGAASDEGEGR